MNMGLSIRAGVILLAALSALPASAKFYGYLRAGSAQLNDDLSSSGRPDFDPTLNPLADSVADGFRNSASLHSVIGAVPGGYALGMSGIASAPTLHSQSEPIWISKLSVTDTLGEVQYVRFNYAMNLTGAHSYILEAAGDISSGQAPPDSGPITIHGVLQHFDSSDGLLHTYLAPVINADPGNTESGSIYLASIEAFDRFQLPLTVNSANIFTGGPAAAPSGDGDVVSIRWSEPGQSYDGAFVVAGIDPVPEPAIFTLLGATTLSFLRNRRRSKMQSCT